MPQRGKDSGGTDFPAQKPAHSFQGRPSFAHASRPQLSVHQTELAKGRDVSAPLYKPTPSPGAGKDLLNRGDKLHPHSQPLYLLVLHF